MKKISLIIITMLLVTSGIVFAEKEVDVVTKSYQGEMYQQPGVSSFDLEVIRLDFSELNSLIEDAGFAPLDNNVVLFGGGGLTAFGPEQRNLVGGYGLGGFKESTEGEQKALFSIGYGGALYERKVWDNEENGLGLTAGALFGGGSATLELVYKDVDSMKDVINAESPVSSYFKKSFLLLQPRVGLYKSLYNKNGLNVGLNMTAGYLFTYDFGRTWVIGTEKIDGPLSNFHGPSLKLGLWMGY